MAMLCGKIETFAAGYAFQNSPFKLPETETTGQPGQLTGRFCAQTVFYCGKKSLLP